jgi:GT2 family glycosyltransferase
MRTRAVVVNYNGGEEIRGCLRALLASEGLPGVLEIVVVDNGSVDGSPEWIEAELPQVRLHRSPGNLGYPAINQVVEDLAAIDAVAIVNPDTVVAPDCLALLAAALVEDPKVGAACPLIVLDGDYREVHVELDGPPGASVDLLDLDGAERWHLTGPNVRRRWRRGVAWTIGNGSVLRTTAAGPITLRLRGSHTGRLRLTSGDQRVEVPVGRAPFVAAITPGGAAREIVQNAGSVIGPRGVGINRGYHEPVGPTFAEPVDLPAWCGAGVLLRSDYLRDVGLLDPRWFLYYEDTDLSWRGLLRGWRYRYVPAAKVRHAHSTTIGHGSALYDVQHLRNRLLTVTKCAPAGEVVAAWVDALALLVRQLRRDLVGRVVRDRRPPELVMTGRWLRALFAAARLTPSVLRDRRSVRGGATVADDALPVLGRWHDDAKGVA